MAIKNIKLTKNVISNRYSNDIHTKNFDKLAKSDESVDKDTIINTYNTVFYSIPKIGKNSHTSIVKRTYDYLNFSENQLLETQIENLISQINEKSAELIETQDPETKEHPLYNNGTFLIAGENGEKYPGMHTIYVMQEGLKRPFDNDGTTYEAVRKSLNLAHKDNPNTVGNEKFSNKYYLTVDELNAIPDGKRITTAADLALKGDELPSENVELSIKYSSYELLVKCIGRETSEDAELLLTDPDFYIEATGGCVIEYVSVKPVWSSNAGNQQSVDKYTPSIKTVVMNKNQTATITIGKNTNRQADDAISDDVIYTEISPPQLDGTSVANYIKKWGKGNKYEGITKAEGRIEYIEIRNDNINHDPQDNYKVLNGLPSGFNLSLSAPGNEISSFGTRIIYPAGSDLYGDQNQESGIQEIFDNPNSAYYHPFFYGQPIIRYDNDYLVFFNGFRGSVGPFNATAYAFLSLEKKEANEYPYGFAAVNFYEDGSHSSISYTGIPQDTAFQNLIKDQIRIYKGNKIDDFFPDEGDEPISWWKVKDEGRIKYHGLVNIGTIGYNVVAPLKGSQNAFQSHNVMGPPSMPNV